MLPFHLVSARLKVLECKPRVEEEGRADHGVELTRARNIRVGSGISVFAWQFQSCAQADGGASWKCNRSFRQPNQRQLAGQPASLSVSLRLQSQIPQSHPRSKARTPHASLGSSTIIINLGPLCRSVHHPSHRIPPYIIHIRGYQPFWTVHRNDLTISSSYRLLG